MIYSGPLIRDAEEIVSLNVKNRHHQMNITRSFKVSDDDTAEFVKSIDP
jgi:hypothetical protein